MAWPDEVQYAKDSNGNVVGLVNGSSSIYLGNKDIATKRIKVGMNYFPGWSTPGGGPNPSAPWAIIPMDRLPLQGAYDETSQSVIDNQIRQMRDYGIDFVMIDWFYDTTTHSSASSTLVGSLDHWVNGFMASTVSGKPKFCINWANATNGSYLTNAGFANAITKFITDYFPNSNYYKIDNKPVMGWTDYTITVGTTHPNISPATTAGLNTLFTNAKASVVAAGYSDLYIVAGSSTSADFWKSAYNTAPVDAVWPLNVNVRYQTGTNTPEVFTKTTFADIDYVTYGAANGVYESWSEGWLASTAVSSGNIDLWTHVSAGFDQHPWNESTKLHGIPTEAEFATHLMKARAFAEANLSKTKGIVIIQSWNEHGEGSVCEPNVNSGFTKLQLIKDILSC